jgi:hypothetical protein
LVQIESIVWQPAGKGEIITIKWNNYRDVKRRVTTLSMWMNPVKNPSGNLGVDIAPVCAIRGARKDQAAGGPARTQSQSECTGDA